MSHASTEVRAAAIMRWVARIWSLLIFAFALLKIFTPDPYATGDPIPADDQFLLALWGVAILGLLIAWRWEMVGGMITIATMFIRELAWVLLKGPWLVNFLIVWAFIVPPALLFMIAQGLERKARRA